MIWIKDWRVSLCRETYVVLLIVVMCASSFLLDFLSNLLRLSSLFQLERMYFYTITNLCKC